MRQEEALSILKSGANVFLTGEPGSGKTHTVNQYVTYLREHGIGPSITASTGIAATHIGGFTVHSWSGIGVKRNLSKHDLDRLSQNKKVVQRIRNAHVLIIDEVSMLSARVLGMVDAVCREVRRSAQPFGGLQVVLVGDFFQLPPVSSRNERSEEGKQVVIDDAEFAETDSSSEGFAFESSAWSTLHPLVCYLSEQYRQEDEKFLDLLLAIRRANFSEPHKALLRTRYSPTPKEDTHTQLYTRNVRVDSINENKLAKLAGSVKTFSMIESGPKNLVESLKKGCLSPETLSIKVGARVMFTKNDVVRHRYVNGTLGVVRGFSKETGQPIVKTHSGKTIEAEPSEWRIEDSGRVLAHITQIPLRLAWAMTVHKSQGMSLDSAHMDLSDTFEYGQGYVALSRVRTLGGLSLAGLNARALEVHPSVCQKDRIFRRESDETRAVFSRMSSAELSEAHKNFIRACGGREVAIRPEAGKGQEFKQRISTYEKTRTLAVKGLSVLKIAKERGLAVDTVIGHLEKLVAGGKIRPNNDLSHLKPEQKCFEEIERAFKMLHKESGTTYLSPVHELLGGKYDYNEIRLARLFVRIR